VTLRSLAVTGEFWNWSEPDFSLINAERGFWFGNGSVPFVAEIAIGYIARMMRIIKVPWTDFLPKFGKFRLSKEFP
jgi:hypothetical protein